MFKYLLSVAFMVVVLVIGCGASGPLPFHYTKNVYGVHTPVKVIPIWIEGSFGTFDQLAIDDSIAQWNYALNGYIHLEVRSTTFNMEVGAIMDAMREGGWLILKIDSMNPRIVNLPSGGMGTLAWADSIGGYRIFVIRDRVPNAWVAGVVLHEMGHLLGSEHDDVYLMQPIFNWAEYRCVDYEALRRVAEYQHIPVSELNYCVYGEAANLPASCKISPQ